MKFEIAQVKGYKLKYVEGDTEPPPRIRKCQSCGERYEHHIGRLCGCFEKEYAAWKASQTKVEP